MDLDGKVHEEDAEGLFATCIQHEIDHLNGVLFMDYLSKLKRDRVLKKFKKPRSGRSSQRSRSQRPKRSMPLRLIFMGTPDFAVPTLPRACMTPATRSRPSIRARRNRPGAA